MSGCTRWKCDSADIDETRFQQPLPFSARLSRTPPPPGGPVAPRMGFCLRRCLSLKTTCFFACESLSTNGLTDMPRLLCRTENCPGWHADAVRSSSAVLPGRQVLQGTHRREEALRAAAHAEAAAGALTTGVMVDPLTDAHSTSSTGECTGVLAPTRTYQAKSAVM